MNAVTQVGCQLHSNFKVVHSLEFLVLTSPDSSYVSKAGTWGIQ